MNSILDKFLVLSRVLSLIIFILTVTILGLIVPGYSQKKNFISEIAAQSSSIKSEMNVFGFFLPGLLIFLFSIGLYRTIELEWSEKLGAILLSLGGISFASIAFFPGNPYDNVIGVHDVMTIAPVYLTFISFFFLGYQGVYRRGFNKLWSYGFLILGIVTAILIFIYTQDIFYYKGIVQRITIAIPYLMVATASVYLYWFKFVRNRNKQKIQLIL